MADIVPQAIPPVQVVPAVPAPLAAVVAAAPAANLTLYCGGLCLVPSSTQNSHMQI